MLTNKISNDRQEITFVRSLEVRRDKMPLLGGKCYWAYHIPEFGIGATGETQKLAESNLTELVVSIHASEGVVSCSDRMKVLLMIESVDMAEKEFGRKLDGINLTQFYADVRNPCNEQVLTIDSLRAIEKEVGLPKLSDWDREPFALDIDGDYGEIKTLSKHEQEGLEVRLAQTLTSYGLEVPASKILIRNDGESIINETMYRASLILIGNRVWKNRYGDKGKYNFNINVNLVDADTPLIINWPNWRDDELNRFSDNIPY